MPDPLAVSLVLWGRKGMTMAKPQKREQAPALQSGFAAHRKLESFPKSSRILTRTKACPGGLMTDWLPSPCFPPPFFHPLFPVSTGAGPDGGERHKAARGRMGNREKGMNSRLLIFLFFAFCFPHQGLPRWIDD